MQDELDNELSAIPTDPRVYEASFLLPTTLSQEELEKEIEEMRAVITKAGGEIIQEGKPREIKLAYPIAKTSVSKKTVYDNAFFGWIKFGLLGENISIIKKFFEENSRVIRFILIKTTRETPIARRPAPLYKMKEGEPKITKEESGPVDEAQLDKEIEELLTT